LFIGNVGTPTADTDVKIGFAVAATNDAELYQDGSSIGTDTTHSLPTNSPTTFNAGTDVAGNSVAFGHIKNIRYWPLRLTDTEMTTLTNNG
jgi:hypothetical protein